MSSVSASRGLVRARRVLPNGLQVVLYHHLTDHPTNLVDKLGVSISPALFEAHLRRLARDYEVVDLDQVLTGRLPRRALLITFDDGYRSVADVALPILAQLGLPSVFFVSSAYVEPESLPLDNLLCRLCSTVGVTAVETAISGRSGAARTLADLLVIVAALPYRRVLGLGDELADRFGVDRARLRAESGIFLDRSELAGLADRNCEVGNHTRSHLFCRAIVDQAAAREQLLDHRLQLERWAGAPVRSFSYPYGSRRDATPFVARTLRESGHEASFLVEARRNVPEHAGPTWNRVSLDGRPLWRLDAELEVLPLLRSARDRLHSTPARR